MNFADMLTPIAKIADTESPTIFPFPAPMLVIVAILSVIFFGYRFAVQRKPFQLIFAIAPPISLLLLFSENKKIFYTVGIIELVLILTAFVTSIVCKPKKAEGKHSESKNIKED